MKAERARLARLRRLEKVRAFAKQAAAQEAAAAESTLAHLQSLFERTSAMAAQYGARREAADGAALRQLGHFVQGLTSLSQTTQGDAARARAIADAKLRLLAEAERRRAATEDRAALQEKMIAKSAQMPVLGARKGSGTGLE